MLSDSTCRYPFTGSLGSREDGVPYYVYTWALSPGNRASLEARSYLISGGWFKMLSLRERQLP